MFKIRLESVALVPPFLPPTARPSSSTAPLRWLGGWMDGWMDEWMDGSKPGWIHKVIEPESVTQPTEPTSHCINDDDDDELNRRHCGFLHRWCVCGRPRAHTMKYLHSEWIKVTQVYESLRHSRFQNEEFALAHK